MTDCAAGLGDEIGVDGSGDSVSLGELEAIAGFGAGVSAGVFGEADGGGCEATVGLDEGGGSPGLPGSDFLESLGGVAAVVMGAGGWPSLAGSVFLESLAFDASAALGCDFGSSGFFGSSVRVVERRDVRVDGDCGLLPTGMDEGDSPFFDESGVPPPMGEDAAGAPFFGLLGDPGIAVFGADSPG